jgi:hypothetical protein
MMPKGRVRIDDGVRFELFDLDDLEDATVLEAGPDRLRLGLDDDETLELGGAFEYEGGPLPVGGEITSLKLIDDGETVFALSRLSVDVGDLIAAMADDDEDEAAEEAADAAEAAAEALVERFDVDLFEEGEPTLSEPGRFEVSYDEGETVAAFLGDFVYPEGGGLPVSGTITGFELIEDGEVERSLDGLSVDVAALIAAMELLGDDDEDDDRDGREGGRGRGRRDDDEDEATFSLLEGLLDGHDKLKGGSADDDIFGESGRDKLYGKDGDDTLDGGDGRDKLFGQKGDDLLDGGLGRDVMRGGEGADVFLYDSAEDSTKGRNKDKVRDFEAGVDTLDLAGIDADETEDGDQAFFLGGRKFSGEAGELVIKGNKIKGDIDGDGRADFLLMLRGARHLDEDDLFL